MKWTNFLLLFAFILFFGCSGKNSKEINIGANLPLSGTVAYYGLSAQKGINLALKELNQKGFTNNLKIKMVYEDNQGQAKSAITVMDKLINIDKVPVIIGGGSSVETLAAAPVANQNKIALLSPISSASKITLAGPYIYRTCPTDNIQAEDLGKWVLENKYKTVSIVFVNSTWATSFKDDFVKNFQNNGGIVSKIESSDPGDTDFRTQLISLKKSKKDALVFIIYAKEGGAIVRQAKELGMNEPIFGADPWSQEDFRNSAGKFAENVHYTTPVQYDGQTFKEFRDKYFKEYNEEPDVYSSNGYDCLMIIAKALESGARTGDEIKNYFDKQTGFMGATGLTKFDGNGDVVGKHFGRFVIKNGTSIQIN